MRAGTLRAFAFASAVLGGTYACGDIAKDAPTAKLDAGVAAPSPSPSSVVDATADATPADVDAAPDAADPHAYACAEPLPAIAGGIRPGVAADSVEWRLGREKPLEAGGYDRTGPATWGATWTTGTPCAAAKDHASCIAAFDALAARPIDPDVNVSNLYGQRYEQLFVYTRGDDVVALRMDPVAIGAFLAPIDTLEEALFLLEVNGEASFSCEHQYAYDAKVSNGYRHDADGSWEFIGDNEYCVNTVAHWKVSVDGTITLLGTDPSPPAPNPGYCGE